MNAPDAIPTASFHALVEALAKNTASPFALQIGAMDGVKFDLLHPHLIQGGWRGLLVEPVPDMFASLQNTYRTQTGLMLANCAIGERDGTMVLKRIRPEVVAKGLVPEEALGMTTSIDSGALLNQPQRTKKFPVLKDEYMTTIEVPCLTLPHLLEQHKVGAIDLVVIDTEGADWMIAKQIDLARYRPQMICIEHTSLLDADKRDCVVHFMQNDYRGFLCQEDAENFLFVKNAV